jgi:amyloid beta precursor protein binding protein 1
VISASATSTSILKNLVLPGIGHFTILDHANVSHSDAGNNFFLEGTHSIGKYRAEETVRLLSELNDGVEGSADTRTLESILESHPEWITSFTIVVAHNLDHSLLRKLSALLWKDSRYPPLVVVRSAGFLADFYIQFHEHTSMSCLLSLEYTYDVYKSSRVTRKHHLLFALTGHSQLYENSPFLWSTTQWTQQSTDTYHMW